jgi:sugar phosphate isomerase/epimerase
MEPSDQYYEEFSRVKIGLDTFCYQISLAAGTYDIFGLIDRMRYLGVGGLQININGENGRFLGADPGDTTHFRRVREALEERAFFAEVGGRSTNPEMLEWQMRLCSDLGADVLRTAVVLKDTFEETRAYALHDLGEVLPLAHELDVRIALENHEDLTAEELASIVEDVDDHHVGVCLDTGNGLCIYEDPLETVARLAPHAISTHVKDQRLVRVDGRVYSIGVRLGSGDVDLPKVIEIVRRLSGLDRLLIQDTTGYSAPMDPFGRGLKPVESFQNVPEMSHGELEEEGMLLSLEGLDADDLLSWASRKDRYIEEDIAYLKTLVDE